MLLTSIFSVSHNVSKSLISQNHSTLVLWCDGKRYKDTICLVELEPIVSTNAPVFFFYGADKILMLKDKIQKLIFQEI